MYTLGFARGVVHLEQHRRAPWLPPPAVAMPSCARSRPSSEASLGRGGRRVDAHGSSELCFGGRERATGAWSCGGQWPDAVSAVHCCASDCVPGSRFLVHCRCEAYGTGSYAYRGGLKRDRERTWDRERDRERTSAGELVKTPDRAGKGRGTTSGQGVQCLSHFLKPCLSANSSEPPGNPSLR